MDVFSRRSRFRARLVKGKENKENQENQESQESQGVMTDELTVDLMVSSRTVEFSSFTVNPSVQE